MVLCDYVKQHKTMQKIVFFTWGRGNLIMFLVTCQPNGPLPKKNHFGVLGHITTNLIN